MRHGGCRLDVGWILKRVGGVFLQRRIVVLLEVTVNPVGALLSMIPYTVRGGFDSDNTPYIALTVLVLEVLKVIQSR